VSSQLTDWDLDLDAIFGSALAFGYGETLDHDTTIHELRLISSSDSSLAWLAGVYSFDLDADATGAQFVDPDVLALFGVDSSVIPKDRAWGVTAGTVNRRVTNEELAVYGELSWPFSDAITVKVGGRYSQYSYTRVNQENYVSNVLDLAFSGGGLAATSPVLDEEYTTGDKSESIFNASVQWMLNEQEMLYASVSEGFRRAHPNSVITNIVDSTDPSFVPVIADADTLWNYELGYKALMLDDRFSLNAAVYRIEWADAQVSASRQSDAAPYTTNAGDIEAHGIELDMNYLISDALEMGGSISVSKSEVVSIDELSSLASGLTEGASLVGSDTQISAFAEYRIWAQGDASINTRIDAQYFSDYNNGPKNIPGVGVPNPRFIRTDAITNINFQVGYENRHWGLYLYAENVTSNDDRVWQNPAPFSDNNIVTLNPRTIGLRLDYQL
jgi:outer membrane receptor for monomeric catechols